MLVFIMNLICVIQQKQKTYETNSSQFEFTRGKNPNASYRKLVNNRVEEALKNVSDEKN